MVKVGRSFFFGFSLLGSLSVRGAMGLLLTIDGELGDRAGRRMESMSGSYFERGFGKKESLSDMVFTEEQIKGCYNKFCANC